MEIRAEEISQIIRSQIRDYEKKVEVAETGTVLSVGDGIARIYGLDKAMYGELLALPHDYKMVVLLADLEGFSYKESAEIIDVPIRTVMSRLHRGRKALQKKLWSLAEQRGLTGPSE